jgi:hypothetical protein
MAGKNEGSTLLTPKIARKSQVRYPPSLLEPLPNIDNKYLNLFNRSEFNATSDSPG